jgi:hypothetical protein
VDPPTFFFLARRHLFHSPPPPTQGAQFLAHTAPPTMHAGRSYTVSITMRNTGTATWTREALYRLGSQNPEDNLTWGLGRVDLPPAPAAIAPGAQVTFTFTASAPATPGRYDFQWQMVQEHVAWFGDTTPNVVVTVTEASVGEGE